MKIEKLYQLAGKFCLKGDCYVVDVTTKRGYEGSEHYCRNIGFSLAKITDDVESNYVGDLVKESSADSSFTYSLIGMYVFISRCLRLQFINITHYSINYILSAVIIVLRLIFDVRFLLGDPL